MKTLAISLALLVGLAGATRADTASEGYGSNFREQWDNYRQSMGNNTGSAADRQAALDSQNAADRAARATGSAANAAALAAARQQITYGTGVIRSYLDLIGSYRALNTRDAPFDPSVHPDGAPDLPVSCASSDCTACYREAQTALNSAMFTLGRLRTLYLRTKTFVDNAIAFGDSSSGIHAVVGLAWQKEKKGIQDSMAGMNTAFDRKKPELMTALKTALDKIGACEAQFYSNPDWYNRFGFIYYQFMDQKYAR